jgi:hypothetical protein
LGGLQSGGVMMTIPAGAGALDYFPCRYGASRAVFRGPERDLSRPYVAMLGGSATFGKYVATPFPALVEQALGQPVANLGAQNAGPDFYLNDRVTLDIAARARVAVVQVTGADTLSNPFYTVHARRNDRFLAASPALRALFPEVDLTDIHFTRHLLQVLHRTDPQRFQTVRQALQSTWLGRMRQLLAHLPPRRVLLWLADTAPPDSDLGSGPLFVDRALLDALRPAITDLVQVAAPLSQPADTTCPETEAVLAACLPGASVHEAIAAALTPVLTRLAVPLRLTRVHLVGTDR